MNATREQKMEWYKADIEKKFRALHAHITMAKGMSEELGYAIEADLNEYPDAATIKDQSQSLNMIASVRNQLEKLMGQTERAAKRAGIKTTIVEE